MLLIVVLLAIISAISCRRDGNVTCGSTVDLTVDDYNFWNPGYPSQVNTSVSKTSPCSVTVSRGPKPGVICILEVILNDLELAPAENGECKLDQLIVSGGKVLTEEGEGVPMVPQCGTGTLRRHHFFLFDEMKPIVVEIKTTGDMPRKWSLGFDGVPCFGKDKAKA